jgi:catechol 1,2-dioxygenase
MVSMPGSPEPPDVTLERLWITFEDLNETLRAFIRRNRITPSEFRLATMTIVDSIHAGEGTMIFDTFLEADTADVATVDGGSTHSMAGPFYRSGAPAFTSPCRLPQRDGENGQPLVFVGSVRDVRGETIADAELDIWQADATGGYSQFDPEPPPWNLRGLVKVDDDGGFAITTIQPPPYEIPKDGPTGALLRALGRHAFRPAHLHVIVRAHGYVPLTAQLYFPGDQYLDNDAVRAVRDGLVMEVTTSPDGNTATFDFVLTEA